MTRPLELGAGSGLNFGYYGNAVQTVYALEPSAELRRKAAPRARQAVSARELGSEG